MNNIVIVEVSIEEAPRDKVTALYNKEMSLEELNKKFNEYSIYYLDEFVCMLNDYSNLGDFWYTVIKLKKTK